ncbi:type II toxin-antitoxin system Phd/YefM family antitoxin [Phyllobacterium sp. LjRoot231]|uniref:type II toxin-antitoxin system Phd/YefM family antitoxin n=1 Tax=Phyllobacterium sp. LjRoot231 TaxID=3342289 RepID=UPI003ECF63E0
MARFTLTDLGNKSGEVVEAAFNGPVDITKRGKRKFVLMTADQFDRLKSASSQRAFRSDDLTTEERDSFLSGLDAVAHEGDRSND